MKLILLGPPGAGKGTQAHLLCNKFNIPQIATGNILRAAVNDKTELGIKVQQIMSAGKLVSDDIMIAIIKNRIMHKDCNNGFLLDGFPRTINQAQALIDNKIIIDAIVEIKVTDEDIITRLSGRLVHLPSGRSYHNVFNPPKISNQDDITKEPLTQREDDSEQVVRHRIKIYHQQTTALINFYKQCQANYISVDGSKAVVTVSKNIINKLI